MEAHLGPEALADVAVPPAAGAGATKPAASATRGSAASAGAKVAPAGGSKLPMVIGAVIVAVVALVAATSLGGGASAPAPAAVLQPEDGSPAAEYAAPTEAAE